MGQLIIFEEGEWHLWAFVAVNWFCCRFLFCDGMPLESICLIIIKIISGKVTYISIYISIITISIYFIQLDFQPLTILCCSVEWRMEKLESEESIQALRNLVLLIGSLCTCGFIELKPGSKTGSLFQMPGFVVPQPSGKGKWLMIEIINCIYSWVKFFWRAAVTCVNIHNNQVSFQNLSANFLLFPLLRIVIFQGYKCPRLHFENPVRFDGHVLQLVSVECNFISMATSKQFFTFSDVS